MNNAGTRQIRWNGLDIERQTVISGIYYVKASGKHSTQHVKEVFIN